MTAGPQPPGANSSAGTLKARSLEAKPSDARIDLPRLADNGLATADVLPKDLIAQILDKNAPDQADIAVLLEKGADLS